ncbi:MAG: shikimate kinase [Bacillota bacterium]|nr:shikimate kinase [Bacillota bacterium]
MKKYGLIGEKLGHSFSPQIHEMLYGYDYRLYEVPRNGLPDFLKNTGLSGFNVTIPYKQDVIPFCGTLAPNAEEIGSVNTVIRESDGSLSGYNTDYFGFEYMLKKSGFSVSGKKVLVLGSGGASKTVVAVLKNHGASPVVIISRNGEDNYENISRHFDAEAIVNTTPVGMYPDTGRAPVNLKDFKCCRLVLDLIYNPHRTEFLLEAEDLGIPAYNGLTMLVAQAKKAGDLFTSSNLDEDIIEKTAALISAQTRNIALIGMPGSGKTTVGRKISEITGREFADLDEEIEKALGRTIPEVIAEEGVPYFRAAETRILREISKKSGMVIATGGGVVTIPENRRLLKQNSFTVLIERPLSELESDGRPLSQSKGVETLYKERKQLYLDWSDFKVNNTAPESTAKEIIETISKL